MSRLVLKSVVAGGLMFAAILATSLPAQALMCISRDIRNGEAGVVIIEGSVTAVRPVSLGHEVTYTDVVYRKGSGEKSVVVLVPSNKTADGGIIAGADLPTPAVGERWRVGGVMVDGKLLTSACDDFTRLAEASAKDAGAGSSPLMAIGFGLAVAGGLGAAGTILRARRRAAAAAAV